MKTLEDLNPIERIAYQAAPVLIPLFLGIIGVKIYNELKDRDNLVERGDNTPPINVSGKLEAHVDNKKATIIYCDSDLSPKYASTPDGTALILLDEYKNAGEPVIYASEPLLYRGNIANAFTPTNPQDVGTKWYLKKSDGNVVTLDSNQVKESHQAFLKLTIDNARTAAFLKRAHNSR